MPDLHFAAPNAVRAFDIDRARIARLVSRLIAEDAKAEVAQLTGPFLIYPDRSWDHAERHGNLGAYVDPAAKQMRAYYLAPTGADRPWGIHFLTTEQAEMFRDDEAMTAECFVAVEPLRDVPTI